MGCGATTPFTGFKFMAEKEKTSWRPPARSHVIFSYEESIGVT